jgi:hypothetical protein
LFEKREVNSSYLSNVKYLNIINELKGGNISRRLNTFEIINIGGEEKFIAPVEKGSTNLLHYVKNDELYDILNEKHLNIGHGGKHRMMAEIKKKIQKFDSRSCTYVHIIYCMLNIFNIVNDLQ